jgi:hypothetical protein
MRGVARRFGYGSLVALGVPVATGWAMVAHCDLFGHLDSAVKDRPRALVIGLTLLHLRRPKLRALQAAIRLASLAIV